MKKAFLLSAFTLLIIFSSCKKCPCTKAQLIFDLINFSNADADTIIIKRYDLNGNFNLPKDSSLIDATLFARFNDTLKAVGYLSNILIESSYNYEIVFPGAGKTYRISEIIEERSYQSCGGIFAMDKVGCLNQIKSLKVDGVPTTVYLFNRFYIRK